MIGKKTSLQSKQNDLQNQCGLDLDLLQLQSCTQANEQECFNRMIEIQGTREINNKMGAQASSDGFIDFGDLQMQSNIRRPNNNRFSCAISSDLTQSVLLTNQMNGLKINQKCVVVQQNTTMQVNANEKSISHPQNKQWDDDESMMGGNANEGNRIKFSGIVFNETFQQNFDNFDLQSNCIKKGKNGARGILLEPINGVNIVQQRNPSKQARPSTGHSMMRSVI